MKRTPLKRTRMKHGKRKSKYARRGRDIDFMMFVKTLPCLLAGIEGAGPCSGVVEADHAGLDSGLGQKAPDRTCVPMCPAHHLDRHSCSDFFGKREDETHEALRQRKREWRRQAIVKTQAEHEATIWFHGELDKEMSQ